MGGEIVTGRSVPCDGYASQGRDANEQSGGACTCPFCGRSFPASNPDPSRHQCRCLKCGYTWRSINMKPLRCPKCRSKAWSRPDLLCHCYKCGHEWTTRKDDVPSRCPKCRTVRWNDPAMVTKRVRSTPPPQPKFSITNSDPLTIKEIIRLSAENDVATLTLMKQALKTGALRMKR